MTCYYPVQAVRTQCRTKSGKFLNKMIGKIGSLKVRNFLGSFVGSKSDLLVLPCGQCTGCRLERSRQWAVRCEKEIQTVESNGGSNCFITLTFDDEHLLQREVPMSLDKRDFQLFMKRFRKRVVYDYYSSKLVKYRYRFSKKFLLRFASEKLGKIRYYHCGEYGELYKRPHYHAIIFNYDFPDKKLWRIVNGNRLYTSEILSELWPYGFVTVGAATFESAAYVARYIMKKHLGKDAWKNYYEYLDEETGELVGHRIPEYTTMSRRSGIGKEWFDKYLLDVYPKDKIFVRGKMVMCKPPRYCDSLYEHYYPSDFQSLKESRISNAEKHSFDQTLERLIVREKVLLSRIKNLNRNLE